MKKKKKKKAKSFSKKIIPSFWAGLTLEMPAGGSYLCFILMSEGLEMHLPRVHPKEQGSGKCAGNHGKGRVKERSSLKNSRG